MSLSVKKGRREELDFDEEEPAPARLPFDTAHMKDPEGEEGAEDVSQSGCCPEETEP